VHDTQLPPELVAGSSKSGKITPDEVHNADMDLLKCNFIDYGFPVFKREFLF